MSRRHRTMVTPICQCVAVQRWFRSAFWLGVALFVFGQVADFVPGYRSHYDLVDGICLLPGVLVPRWPYRIAAIILTSICILSAADDYRRNPKYHGGGRAVRLTTHGSQLDRSQ
jgi:hypothetical protein